MNTASLVDFSNDQLKNRYKGHFNFIYRIIYLGFIRKIVFKSNEILHDSLSLFIYSF